jgi:hypothetical protein
MVRANMLASKRGKVLQFMPSFYQGIYVQRHPNGEIHSVQVVSPGGHSMAITPELYLTKEVEPPMDSLPGAEQYLREKG